SSHPLPSHRRRRHAIRACAPLRGLSWTARPRVERALRPARCSSVAPPRDARAMGSAEASNAFGIFENRNIEHVASFATPSNRARKVRAPSPPTRGGPFCSREPRSASNCAAAAKARRKSLATARTRSSAGHGLDATTVRLQVKRHFYYPIQRWLLY